MLVSFPRSGHHLLVRGLQQTSDHRVVYSEYYSVEHNMTNCDYVNLQKSHDFDLDLPIHDDLNYIVMFRSFDDAIQSWAKAEKIDDLKQFSHDQRLYFDQFMDKWVFSDRPNIWLIDYDVLIKEKRSVLTNAARTMGFVPDEFELNRWVHSERWKYS